MHRRYQPQPRASQQPQSAAPKMQVVETKVIGKGAYGAAVLCKDKDGEHLIKKQIKCRSNQEVRDAKQEAKFLENLKSTNVIGYKAVEQKNSREINIFMEYADGGDLGDEISRRAKKREYYTEEELLDRFADISKAIDKMHKAGVVHRDIKPANIFLNKDGQAKLGDFGIARSCSKNGRVQTPIGTPLYLDPQRCRSQSYGQKADIWSLGCVLYEMATLRPAFDARSMPELKRKVASGRVDLTKIPSQYSPVVKHMISKMLEVNESRRASVDEVMKNEVVSVAVRRRSSNNSSHSDGGDSPTIVSEVPKLPSVPGSPALTRKGQNENAKKAPVDRGRSRQVERLQGGARARSQSPLTSARGRVRKLADENAAPGMKARPRSLSPSVRTGAARRVLGQKGPSPLANIAAKDNHGTPSTKPNANQNITPENPKGRNVKGAPVRALDQVLNGVNGAVPRGRAAARGAARGRAASSPWARVPPIRA